MLFDEIERVKFTYNLDDEDAYSHQLVLTLYDNIEGISAMSEGLSNVDELINKINLVFNGEEKGSIQLSTVHKAKGLEADNIYILIPSLMPSRIAKKEWERKTETNLIYVAITRAKKTLNYIDEEQTKWCKSNGAFDLTKMKDKLNDIKNKIKYNAENGIKESNIAQYGSTLRTLNKLGSQTPISTQNINKKKKAGLKLAALMN